MCMLNYGYRWYEVAYQGDNFFFFFLWGEGWQNIIIFNIIESIQTYSGGEGKLK